jgi:hypothetical protein
VALVIFVGLAQVMNWRDGRFAEQFTTMASLNITAVRHDKNRAYTDAGLKFFFSDGSLSSDLNLLFFSPSVNDIACNLGSTLVQRNACKTENSHIHNLSRIDRTTLLHPSADCTHMVPDQAMREPNPMYASDATLRVFNSIYMLSKMCVTVPARIERGGSKIHVDSNSYGGRILALLRPSFIAMPLANLVSVGYDAAPNSVAMFDSAASNTFVVSLQEVTSNHVCIREEGQTMDVALRTLVNSGMDIRPERYSSGTDLRMMPLPLTLHYMKYWRKLPNPPSTSGGATVHNVVTLYFDINSIDNGVATDVNLFTLRSQTFQVTLSRAVGGSKMIKVNTGNTRFGADEQSVPAMKNSFVIVTYTSNLLIIASLHRNRVVIKHFPGQNIMKANDADITSAMIAGAAPLAAFPYTNTCIPNFADLAINFGVL